MTRVASDARETQREPDAVWRVAHTVSPETPEVLVKPERGSGEPVEVCAWSRTVEEPRDWTRVTTRLSFAAVQVLIDTGVPPMVIVVSTSPLRMFCSSVNGPDCGGEPGPEYSSNWPMRARGLAAESGVVPWVGSVMFRRTYRALTEAMVLSVTAAVLLVTVSAVVQVDPLGLVARVKFLVLLAVSAGRAAESWRRT